MKTLVIHPNDITTGFLEVIYEGKGFTVLDNPVSTKVLKQAIKDHDRIIMMGHGDDSGLFEPSSERYIIDSDLVYLLRDKVCVYIWCFAAKFVNRYNLKGFHTGMFISEETEANFFGVYATQKEITESNNRFAELVSKHLDDDDIVIKIDEGYDADNEVVAYNRARLFFND